MKLFSAGCSTPAEPGDLVLFLDFQCIHLKMSELAIALITDEKWMIQY